MLNDGTMSSATVSAGYGEHQTQFQLESRDLGYSYVKGKIVFDYVNLKTYVNEFVAIVGQQAAENQPSSKT
jgi:hypothetical protein